MKVYLYTECERAHGASSNPIIFDAEIKVRIISKLAHGLLIYNNTIPEYMHDVGVYFAELL